MRRDARPASQPGRTAPRHDPRARAGRLLAGAGDGHRARLAPRRQRRRRAAGRPQPALHRLRLDAAVAGGGRRSLRGTVRCSASHVASLAACVVCPPARRSRRTRLPVPRSSSLNPAALRPPVPVRPAAPACAAGRRHHGNEVRSMNTVFPALAGRHCLHGGAGAARGSGGHHGDLAALRAEIAALKQEYARASRSWKRAWRNCEASGASVARARAPAPSAPAVASAPATCPAAVGTAGRNNAFNPAMSVILTGTYANLSQSPDDYRDRRLPAGRRRSRPGRARLQPRRVGDHALGERRSLLLRQPDRSTHRRG